MRENIQRTNYIIFLGFTSTVAVMLALLWFMSPMGLGFMTWPEAHRDLLEHIYQVSYFAGIPAILIAQVVSPILFVCRKRKTAYWLPVTALALFLACVILISASLG